MRVYVLYRVTTCSKRRPTRWAGGPPARANSRHKCACCIGEMPQCHSVHPGTHSAQGTSRIHYRHSTSSCSPSLDLELPGASHNLRARRPPEGVNEVWMAREVAEARGKAVVVGTCGREVHRERAAEDLQNNAAASPNLKLVRKRLVGRTSRRGGGIPEPPDFLIEKSASRSSRAGRGRSGSAPERASGHAAVRSRCFTGLTISVFGRESTGRFKLPPLVEGYDEFDDTRAR